jgi:hypothetical protein
VHPPDAQSSGEKLMPKYVSKEAPIQRAILTYLRLALPGAVIHHSANERGMRGQSAAKDIANAKRNGMVVGFPDLMVLWNGRLMCFEVKAPGGYPSPAQKDVGQQIQAQGGFWAVVRGVDDVQGFLSAWADVRPETALIEHRGAIS